MKSTNKKPYLKTYYKVKKDSAFYREKSSRKNDPIYVFENELFTAAELEKLRKRGYAVPGRLIEKVEHRPCDTVKIFGARWYKEDIGGVKYGKGFIQAALHIQGASD